ncbi:MAG: hypothetical protein JWM80_5320 [Cyanobacteria bacterium RYN_339]|nr:hypothetical protein [Cyanobacteria bacterium RYN_339]
MIMRNTKTSLTTSAVLTAMLAGCAPVPAPAPVATPTAAAASASPGVGASQAPAPTPTPAVAAALTGMIYDLDGAPVEAASVHVHSLSASQPFEVTVGATAGRYAITTLPEGVNVEIEASKPGWTTRKRVGAFTASKAATLDFGAPQPDFTGAGAAYFLSDRPEITRTDPIYDGAQADATKLRYAMTFSTPLDAENQQRFAQAFRLQVLDITSSTADPVASSEANGYPQELDARGVGRFGLRAGTAFRDTTSLAAVLTWSADGTVATFAFDAPVLPSRTADTRCLVLLEAGTAPILDTRGRQLGTSTAGAFTGYPTAGRLVPGVFQAVDPRVGTVPGLLPDSREARWANTHDDARRFVVPRDNVPPHVVGAEITDVDGDARIALTFDEALVAFDGSKAGRLGSGLTSTVANLQGFSFAVGLRRNDLADLVLNGKNAEQLDPRTKASFGAEGDRHREYRFTDAAVVTSRAGAGTGSVFMELDAVDPRRLLITLVGRRHFLTADITEIAVRFQGPGDPAGNVISELEANAHIFRGAL